MRFVFHTDIASTRLPEPADAQRIFDNYTRDPEVVKYLSWKPHQSVSESQGFVDMAIAANRDASSYFRIIDAPGSKGIGMVEIAVRGFKAELAYVLSRRFWGQGIMTSVLRSVVAELWADESIFRIAAMHHPENIGSQKVLQKAGLKLECILHRYFIVPNYSPTPQDMIMQSLTR